MDDLFSPIDSKILSLVIPLLHVSVWEQLSCLCINMCPCPSDLGCGPEYANGPLGSCMAVQVCWRAVGSYGYVSVSVPSALPGIPPSELQRGRWNGVRPSECLAQRRTAGLGIQEPWILACGCRRSCLKLSSDKLSVGFGQVWEDLWPRPTKLSSVHHLGLLNSVLLLAHPLT